MRYLKSIYEMLDPMGKWNATIPRINKAEGHCDDCDGQGFVVYGKSNIKKKCYGCDGQGFNGVQDENPSDFYAEGDETVQPGKCPDCKGGGDVGCTEHHYDDNYCEKCDNTGLVWCVTCDGLGSIQ